MTDHPGVVRLQWPAPNGVSAVQTTRDGGVGQAPYDSFNLALHVADEPASVAANRARLAKHIDAVPVQWLEQVHGTDVVEVLAQGDLSPAAGRVPRADAAFTRQPGVACAVMTADCLPVLLCDANATCVAAAHAGWRGLVAGVIGQTVAAMDIPGDQLLAYLGPAISQSHFEVGLEVVESVMASATTAQQLAAFTQAVRPSQRPQRAYVDLYAVARVQLQALGVKQIYGGEHCTYGQSQFFSYRRQNPTGRQASLIWLNG